MNLIKEYNFTGRDVFIQWVVIWIIRFQEEATRKFFTHDFDSGILKDSIFPSHTSKMLSKFESLQIYPLIFSGTYFFDPLHLFFQNLIQFVLPPSELIKEFLQNSVQDFFGTPSNNIPWSVFTIIEYHIECSDLHEIIMWDLIFMYSRNYLNIEKITIHR